MTYPWPPPGYQPYQQPGYHPYGQYGQPPAQYPAQYPPRPKTNGFAIASLILGIIGAVLLSVIFGVIALNQTKGGRQGGRGMAIAGLIISGAWVFVIAAIVIAVMVFDNGSVQATNIKTGDCIADAPADGANVLRLPKVSCDEPHEGEVYAMIRVSGDNFPGQAAMQNDYEQRCVSALNAYAPDAANDRGISNFLLYPSQETWDRGDRDVACIAITRDKRTGSIRQ
ncbi:MAG: septum formation family protein [Mycobacterium sp.]